MGLDAARVDGRGKMACRVKVTCIMSASVSGSGKGAEEQARKQKSARL